MLGSIHDVRMAGAYDIRRSRSLISSAFGRCFFFGVSRFHDGALVQDAIEVVPKEKQEQDVVPAFDDVLVIVDG